MAEFRFSQWDGNWTPSYDPNEPPAHRHRAASPGGWAWLVHKRVGVEPGATYRASCWLRTYGGSAQAHVDVQAYDANGRQQAVAGSLQNITATWTEIAFDAVIPAGHTSATLALATNTEALASNAAFSRAAATQVETDPGAKAGALIVWELLSEIGTGADLDRVFVTNESVDDDFPHHIVIRANREAVIDIFVDGQSVARQIIDDDPSTNNPIWPGKLYFGGPPPNWALDYSTGTLDEVALYDRFREGELYSSIYPGLLSDATILAHFEAFSNPWNGDRTGRRIERILQLVGWPDGADLDPGVATLGPAVLGRQTALTYLGKVMESEQGMLYVRPDGKIRFRDRENAYRPPHNTSLVSLGDAKAVDPDGDPPIHPYMALRLGFDDEGVFNVVHASREYGARKEVEDSASQVEFLKRTLSAEGLLLRTDAEVRAIADYLLSRHSQPVVRVEEVIFRPSPANPELFRHALTREVGDRITVYRTPPGGGAAIEADCIIEGVKHDLIPGGWQTTWWLTQVSGPGTPLVWDEGKWDEHPWMP